MSKNGTVKAPKPSSRRTARKAAPAFAVQENHTMQTRFTPNFAANNQPEERISVSLTSGKAWRFTDIAKAQRFLSADIKSKKMATGMIGLDIRLANSTRLDASFHEIDQALSFLDYVAK